VATAPHEQIGATMTHSPQSVPRACVAGLPHEQQARGVRETHPRRGFFQRPRGFISR